MSYLFLLVYAFIICWIIFKAPFFKAKEYPSYIPILLFLSKFAMGVILIWVYYYYYNTRISADVLKYFDDGNIIHSAIFENPLDYLHMLTGIGSESPHLNQYYETCFFWHKEFNYGLINDNRIVIRFNAFFRLFSFGNIYIHTLFMSFFSFTGLWAILKVLLSTFKQQKWLLVLIVFFFPSLWFWTSGLLKEGVITGAFGISFYFISKMLKSGFRVKSFAISLGMLFLLLLSKFYILIAASPGLIFLVINKYQKKKTPWLSFLLIHLGFLILANFSGTIFGIDFISILEQKQADFINYVQSLTNVGSYYEIPDLEPNIWSFIYHSPKAFMDTLFRPTIFESNNPMMLMAAMENLLIILGIIISVIWFNKKNLNHKYLLFSLSFVIILFTLCGLTTPVLGAVVRYKAPALPFLGIIFLLIIDFSKLRTFLHKVLPYKYIRYKTTQHE